MPLVCLPCLDDADRAAALQRRLHVDRDTATRLGRSAVEIARAGHYARADGARVELADAITIAIAARQSVPPDAALPSPPRPAFAQTEVQVVQESTLDAAHRLQLEGRRVLALNFANGVNPGGGFLHGARAQEETLCRSSALYLTLEGDPMYAAHATRPEPDSSDWTILSPGVPVFRTEDGQPLDAPWRIDVATCAAPYAPRIGQPRSGDLLEARIHRLLAVARAGGWTSLVLGAWGCGAFANDPARTARDHRAALEGAFDGAFEHVVFAIADWSPNRRMLGPFRDVFA